jgi:hypothetical protein
MVHRLPADVRRVWGACTPGRRVGEVARAADVDVAFARASMAQLCERDLLDRPATGIGRRRFLQRSALVGAGFVAVPLIQTVLAPSALAACSTNSITLAQGGQDSCTGNSAHAKYTITVQGCDANTNFFPLLTYTDAAGAVVTEVGKTLRTDATGFATSGPGASLTNNTIGSGSTPVSLTLYYDKDHTQPVPGGTVTALFTITC